MPPASSPAAALAVSLHTWHTRGLGDMKLPDLGDIAKVLDTEVARELYKDVRPPVQEASRLLAVLVALVATPFEAAAIYRERLLNFIREAAAEVPEERQLPPAPSMAGPILENVKYLEDGNPLRELYMNLLRRLMDRDRVNEAHPAFPGIIRQLSPDEAHLLWQMARRGLDQPDLLFKFTPLRLSNGQDGSLTVDCTFDERPLLHPMHTLLYAEHLETLGLAFSYQRDEEGTENRIVSWQLTNFGRLFAKACIPENFDLRGIERHP